jgi:aspartyl-tRNA synthetase
MHLLKRTISCGELRSDHAGQEVVLNGWVQRRRDHGGLIFVDLRDRSGMIQVVFNPEKNHDAWTKAETIRNEYAVAIKGVVTKRPEGTVNLDLPTGEVEVYADTLDVFSSAKTPPFYITDDVDVDESVRLKYRYLDLRPVLKALAQDAGLVCAVQEDLNVSAEEQARGKFASTWFVMARRWSDLEPLKAQPNWHQVHLEP